MQLWEEDLLLEIDHVIDQNSRKEGRSPRRAPPEKMVPMWDEDAARDEEDARVAPKRPMRGDRRDPSSQFKGENRRTANR
jgi:hypothetical protein